MQIISFLSHYQLVYISFDISSFSLISYTSICVILRGKMRQMAVCFAVFYTMICHKPFYALLSTMSPSLTNSQITPSICEGNYSPLSSENHRSLFVKPAKRGKQRAGGEAERCWCLGFVSLYFICNFTITG